MFHTGIFKLLPYSQAFLNGNTLGELTWHLTKSVIKLGWHVQEYTGNIFKYNHPEEGYFITTHSANISLFHLKDIFID